MILIVCSSVDGHTLSICERIRQTLESAGHGVTLAAVEEADSLNLTAFRTVVIGASIRYGNHRPAVFDFVNTNLKQLQARPSAFFTVNIVARKPLKNRPETNPYLQRFLRQVAWRPAEVEVFAGRLDYPRYKVLDRWMIRFIMWLTNGPTDPRSVVEFTDWARVNTFARKVAAL